MNITPLYKPQQISTSFTELASLAVTVSIRNREVSGSNTGMYTGYLEVSWSCSVSPGKILFFIIIILRESLLKN
jgi:hypothetical protein